MSNQEAIETIKALIGCIEWDFPLDYCEALDMAIKALAKDINVSTKWISVKDRPPTPKVDVLTLDSQGNYYIDRVLRDGRWQETESEWNPVKWWTPLPEPPKEET